MLVLLGGLLECFFKIDINVLSKESILHVIGSIFGKVFPMTTKQYIYTISELNRNLKNSINFNKHNHIYH